MQDLLCCVLHDDKNHRESLNDMWLQDEIACVKQIYQTKTIRRSHTSSMVVVRENDMDRWDELLWRVGMRRNMSTDDDGCEEWKLNLNDG